MVIAIKTVIAKTVIAKCSTVSFKSDSLTPIYYYISVNNLHIPTTLKFRQPSYSDNPHIPTDNKPGWGFRKKFAMGSPPVY